MTATRAGAAALLLATLAAYALAGGTAFQYDDFRVIVGDERVHAWSAWAASMPGMRALTKATYVANWTTLASPAAFAWTGVALHVACSLLVLALANRWLPAMAPACPRPGTAALTCALVFALHPAQTEAVVYAAARSTTLSTLATLAGLYAWERAREGARRGGWIGACVAALAASLAAREAAWTLPFAIVLVEVARGARVRDALRRSAPVLVALLALAAVGATVAAHRRLLASSLAIRGPLENLAAQVDAVSYLVTHPLLTLRVNFDPDLVARPFEPRWWIALACLVAVLAASVMQMRKRPWLAFAILWFALSMLPTHGVLARLELANDRQLYLAMVGPALAAGVVLASTRRRALGDGIAVALVAVLGVATFLRVGDYASEVALWTSTVRASPANARAWNNLGYALAAQGDRAGAKAAYERALALDPASPRARGNLDALER